MKPLTPEEKYQRLLENIACSTVTRITCSSCLDWADWSQGPSFIADKLAEPCECGGTLDAVDVTAEYDTAPDDDGQSLPPDGAPK